MTTPYSSYGTTSNGQPSYTPNLAQTTTPARFSVLNSASFDPNTPSPASRGRGRGAKRGRKPRGALVAGSSSPRPFMANAFPAPSSSSTPTPSSSYAPSSNNANAQYPRVHWAMSGTSGTGEEPGGPSASASAATTMATEGGTSISHDQPGQSTESPSSSVISNAVIDPALMGLGGVGGTTSMGAGIGVTSRSTPMPDVSVGPVLPAGGPQPLLASTRHAVLVPDDEVEGDDEFLPAMADDDYSAQLSWQSQSKDNLKVLMDNLSPAQYDRFEAYRRHALPKQAVRKVIQQSLGHQVSQPVAQIIAGFSKVFVGEIIEKARAVQARRREAGPLSPDHLREAYRAYQEETGHVGAARPLRAKKLFMR